MNVVGSYRAGNTPVHALDARIKIPLLFLLTVTLFLVNSWWGIVAFTGITLFILILAKIPLRDIASGVAPALFVYIFVLLGNSFLFDGSAPVQLWGALGFSPEGCSRGFFAVTRVIIMVVATLVLTGTTSSLEVTDAFTSILGPTRRFNVPVDDIAMVFSLVLRFIPLTGDEMERVLSAQRARGVDFSQGSVFTRIRKWVPILIPVLVGLFRRADNIADAMDARCYRGQGRTQMNHSVIEGKSWLILILGVSVFIALAIIF